jgi:acyl dehydratase
MSTATSPLIIDGVKDLQDRAGTELGISDWVAITQDEVDRFADVTGDHQWIHVDVERAKGSAFGGTIVHGFFTLALGPRLQTTIYEIHGFEFGLNYGLGKVRFPAQFPVGEKVRLRVSLSQVEDVPGGLQLTLVNSFEREGGDKPVCVAEMIFRMYNPLAG